MKRPSTSWINGNTLHVEAPGCIVNIHIGLTTMDGQEVTAVSVKCDRYAGEPKWSLADHGFAEAINLRVVQDRK